MARTDCWWLPKTLMACGMPLQACLLILSAAGAWAIRRMLGSARTTHQKRWPSNIAKCTRKFWENRRHRRYQHGRWTIPRLMRGARESARPDRPKYGRGAISILTRSQHLDHHSGVE